MHDYMRAYEVKVGFLELVPDEKQTEGRCYEKGNRDAGESEPDSHGTVV